MNDQRHKWGPEEDGVATCVRPGCARRRWVSHFVGKAPIFRYDTPTEEGADYPPVNDHARRYAGGCPSRDLGAR